MPSKYRICLIGIYIGKQNTMFSTWLKSCGFNPTVNWLVITDRKITYALPSNVINKVMTFEELIERIQGNFDFPITLTKPYKLCDYRVCYGEVFAEEMKEYDFWGYCDFDVIWGDIRKFITDDILSKYDRIMTNGHMTLMRNSPNTNSLYRTLHRDDVWDFRKVFQVEKTRSFDEWGGANNRGTSWLFSKSGIPVFKRDDFFCDVLYRPYGMVSVTYSMESVESRRCVLFFDKGKLFALSDAGGSVTEKEVMYAHIPRRILNVVDSDCFMVKAHHSAIPVENRKIIEKYHNMHYFTWKRFRPADWSLWFCRKVIASVQYRFKKHFKLL